MQLTIGATVRCQNGEAGRLRYVVVDPHQGQITDLIVQHGRLLKHDVVVPIEWVDHSDEDQIMLKRPCADLDLLPEYREIEYRRPDPSVRPVSGHRPDEVRIWLGPYAAIGGGRPWFVDRVRLGLDEDHAVLIRRGQPVLDRNGVKVGRIHHLVANDQHRVTHLVVRVGDLLRPAYRLVPLDQVAAIEDDGVRLKLEAAALDQLPRYTPPASDAELEARAQQALEQDAHTAGSGLHVCVEDGVAHLQGQVSARVAGAAQRILERMRGILGVIDETTRPPLPRLEIGMPVLARDGRYGSLEKIVVDPHARRVTHLVVGKGWLAQQQRVVPIDAVEYVDEQGIHLDVSSEELNRLPVFQEEAFLRPDPTWEPLETIPAADTLFWGGPYPGVPAPVMPVVEHVTYSGVPSGAIMLRRGADVLCNDAPVGSLDHVLIDPRSGRMTHLIVEELRSGRRVIVPIDWVRELHEQVIVLHTWNPHQRGVPSYTPTRSDAELAAHVRSALEAHPDLAGVEVRVEGSVAQLSGNVASVAAKAEADAIARAVPGIVDVRNALMPDTALTARITAALADDPVTALAPIEVISLLGVVTLQGRVPTPAIRERAEQIARSIPGVRTVINALEVRQPDETDWYVWPGALIER
ncbi:BON domain-containing protein [Kallotenue papyrolyticum]|uniref:BON domain-containing protein n=1 Tax=Kallotenue papyrolyticum TaxID=1325125 RepID=UPI00049249DF|nr:BON domain-containing protein [Kallotenue papyrolyticum]